MRMQFIKRPNPSRDYVVKMKIGGAVYDIYDGDYVVVPSTEEQRLQTASKRMIDDVVVTKVPLEMVTNPAGGFTIIIGG